MGICFYAGINEEKLELEKGRILCTVWVSFRSCGTCVRFWWLWLRNYLLQQTPPFPLPWAQLRRYFWDLYWVCLMIWIPVLITNRSENSSSNSKTLLPNKNIKWEYGEFLKRFMSRISLLRFINCIKWTATMARNDFQMRYTSCDLNINRFL